MGVKMSDFTFDEASHTYYLDGVKIPSVSEIIAPLSDYSGIDKEILDNACNYGKAVHKTIELWLKCILDEDDLSEGLKQPLDEFRKFNISDDFKYPFQCETQSYSRKLNFAGTVDLAMGLVPYSRIVDIKTRKYNPITDDLQLAGYEILANVKCEKYILELLPNKPYNLIKINNKQAKSMFLYMLDYWWKTNEFEKKTNEFNEKLNSWRGK